MNSRDYSHKDSPPSIDDRKREQIRYRHRLCDPLASVGKPDIELLYVFLTVKTQLCKGGSETHSFREFHITGVTPVECNRQGVDTNAENECQGTAIAIAATVQISSRKSIPTGPIQQSQFSPRTSSKGQILRILMSTAPGETRREVDGCCCLRISLNSTIGPSAALTGGKLPPWAARPSETGAVQSSTVRLPIDSAKRSDHNFKTGPPRRSHQLNNPGNRSQRRTPRKRRVAQMRNPTTGFERQV
jgi:hypothetical protein